MRGAMVRCDTSSVACDISMARPMAMPPETPRPCRVKLMTPYSGAFAEIIGDQGQQGVHRLGLVGPLVSR
jgi:hypothetical protein